jgi:hypothetical protein
MLNLPPNENEVHVRLRKAWHKERRFTHTRGLCTLLLWLVAMVLLDLGIDWLFDMPGTARLAMLAGNLAVLGWVAWRGWLGKLVGYNSVRVALEVEGRHPELKNLLVSFVQLGRSATIDASASPALLEAMRSQAVHDTAPINFREIVNYRELKKLFAVSAIAVLLFGGYTVNWPDILKTLFYRMLNPNTALGYPTNTHILEDKITWRLQDGTPLGRSSPFIRHGEPAVLEVPCDGMVPSEGALRLRLPNGKPETVRIARDTTTGKFTHTLTGNFTDFQYSMKIGDATSRTYKVTVVPPPHVVKATVRLETPGYAGGENLTRDELNLAVPEGTKLTWTLQFDRPLDLATLVRLPVLPAPQPLSAAAPAAVGGTAKPATSTPSATARPIEMTVAGDGLSATCKLAADESFPYCFQWTDRQFKFVYREDVRYLVQIETDTPPDLEILRPTSDLKATVRKNLEVTFRGSDNYGLTAASLIYTINDGPEKRGPLTLLSGRNVEKTVAWPIRQNVPDLKEGDVVGFRLELADNHAGKTGPNITPSRAYRITIVSDAEYLRWAFEEQARLLREIQTMHEQETEASKSVETMKSPQTQPDDSAGSSGGGSSATPQSRPND